jgi:hypothetical protein
MNIDYNDLFILETLIATSHNASIAKKEEKDAQRLQIVTSLKNKHKWLCP